MILQRLANRGLYLGELFEDAARRNPRQSITLDAPLIVAPARGVELTVQCCADLIAELAGALTRAGVRPADHVAVYKSDNFDIFLIGCAVSRVGAIPIMLSPGLSGDVVALLLQRCDRPYLIGDQRTLNDELPPSQRTGVRATLAVGGDAPNADLLEPLPGAAHRSSRPGRRLPMLITHTSGTTGLPKLVVHSAFTMRARYRPQAVGARMLIWRRETVAVQVPFVHSRLVTAMAIALRRGLPLVVLRDTPPAEFAGLLARTRPGVIEALPNSLIDWEQLAADVRAPLANLKVLSTTFDAIHPRTIRLLLAASQRSNPVHAQLYGQSEVGPVAGRATTRRHCTRVDGRSVGFAFPGMTAVRVLTGAAAPHIGDIEARTDGRAVTYCGEDERYARQLHDGWWRMGDVGTRGRRGNVYLADREVDLIRGVKSTLEIEDLLMQRLHNLQEVVVIPNEQGQPTPIVVTSDGAPIDPESWRQATYDIALLVAPIQLTIAQVPRTSTKKVQRLALARQLFGTESTRK
jgi:acyl-coenzyme A synthetase/AMP-(fatty) acid ligase